MLTLPAVTPKAAEVEPCGTVTVAGTLATAGDALIAMAAPPLIAADVSVTVQVDPAAGVSDAGLHEIPLKRGVCRIVTVPPLTDVDIPFPVESADIPPVSWTDEDVSRVEPDKARVTEATTLFGIAVESSPQTRQVAVPALLLQVSDLFAAAGPGAKVADVKSAVE